MTDAPNPHRQQGAAWLADGDPIGFGELPEPVDALLQQGVVASRHDRAEAERLFRGAIDLAPDTLPAYLCLYKFHAYGGEFDSAVSVATAGLARAAAQLGWSADYRAWPLAPVPADGPVRFALYTLKALAFIHLRRGERDRACRILDILSHLDQTGSTGWPVVAALAEGLD